MYVRILFLVIISTLISVGNLTSANELVEVYGPKEFKATHRGHAVSDSLQLEQDGRYLLRVENGNGEALSKNNCRNKRRWERFSCHVQNFFISLKGRFTKVKSASIRVDGKKVLQLKNTFTDSGTKEVWMDFKANSTLSVRVRGFRNTSIRVSILSEYVDVIPPVLTIVEPLESSEFDTRTVHISGTSDEELSLVQVNGSPLDLDTTGKIFSGDILFDSDGVKDLNFMATDLAGNVTFKTVSVLINTNKAPVAEFLYGQVANGVPVMFVFDHTGSFDIDGNIVQYIWNFGDSTPELISPDQQVYHAYQLPGSYSVTLKVIDDKGAENTKTVQITVIDQQVPTASFTFSKKAAKAPATITFDGSSSSDPDGTIESYIWYFPNGSQATGPIVSKTFNNPGKKTIVLGVVDNSGGIGFKERSIFITTTEPPVPVIDYTGPFTLTAPATVVLDSTNSYDPDGGTIVYRKWDNDDGQPIVENQNVFQRTFTTPGSYRIGLLVRDSDGDRNKKSLYFTVTEPPVMPIILSFNSPIANSVYQTGATISISGASNVALNNISVNGQTLTLDANGILFTGSVSFTTEGNKNLLFASEDLSGAISNTSLPIVITSTTSQPPVANISTDQRVGSAPHLALFDGSLSSDPEGSELTYHWDFGDGFFGSGVTTSHFFNNPGSYTVKLTVKDISGAEGSSTVSIVANEILVPQDPVNVAPQGDPNLLSSQGKSLEFLYTGADPIQKNVGIDAIVEQRASGISGKIQQKNGTPLPGVRVSVKDKPEYGYTLSRADGEFDLVFNGGELTTLEFSHSGFPPVQRTIRPVWNEHLALETVVMINFDNKVSRVEMNSSVPVLATSSTVTDARGTRSVKIFIPSNTTAKIILPQGGELDAANLSIRMTEYTVGATGQNSMPAPLPSNSGYTYAVELSADEAIAKNATSVTFSQPIPFYVDNFLGFPVGEHVPVGYLDRQKGQWVPIKDGLIIQILNPTNGLAEIDFNGDGQAASAADLTKLGVSDDERRLLAQNYSVGSSLWRVPIDHFTPYDCNWPWGPPTGGMTPPGGGDQPPNFEFPPDFPGDEDEPNKCEMSTEQKQNSVIEVMGQVLREDLFLQGLPVSLHYRSERVPGYQGKKRVKVQVTKSEGVLPIRVEVILEIAGKRIVKEFLSPGFDQYSYIEWDGLDRFGREVTGPVRGRVVITYVFTPQYYGADSEGRSGSRLDFVNSFAQFPPSLIVLATSGVQEMSVVSSYDVNLGNPRSIKESFGGWTPSNWHSYEPASKTLYLGDGRVQTAGSVEGVVETIAGRPNVCGGDGDGPALQMALCNPEQVEVDGDGTIYFTNPGGLAVERITTEGVKERVIGNGGITFGLDGSLAINSGIPFGLRDLKIAPNGDLYILVASYLKRIDKNGFLWSVAGDGVVNSTGDGGLAIDAQITNPLRLAIDSNSNVYLAGPQSSKIRKIDTSGMINTINPTVSSGFNSGDGGPLALATFGSINAISTGPNDELYIAAGNQIRKVGIDGIVETIAGDGRHDVFGDGVMALNASFIWIEDLAVDPLTGSLYLSEASQTINGVSKGSSIRRILGNGVIETVIGSGLVPISGTTSNGYNGDGNLGRSTFLSYPSGIAFTPSGEIIFADRNNHLIRKLRPVLPNIVLEQFVIPARDGRALYVFDQKGLHQETLNARTGATMLTFEYNTDNLLIAQQDAYGRRLLFNRSASGDLESIVSSEGRVYNVVLNPDGWVQSISNSQGETHLMNYWAADGLLKRFQKPEGGFSSFSYDLTGRLTEDSNSEGGFIGLLNVTPLDGGFKTEIQTTSAEGASENYLYTSVGTTRGILQITREDGTVSSKDNVSASDEVRSKSGSVTVTELAPDPRYGMAAPYIKRRSTVLPNGLEKLVELSKVATNANGSLVSLLTETTINELTSQILYTPLSGEIVFTTPLGRVSTATIGNLENPTSIEFPGIIKFDLSYTVLGELDTLTQGARLTKYVYDTQGFLASSTDAMNQQTFFDYDTVGRLTQTTLPDGRIVGYRYDGNGNLVGLTPPGRAEHGFVFNSIDYLQDYNPPLLGAMSTTTSYEYSKDKKLTAIRRPDGRDIIYNYSPTKKHLSSIVTNSGFYGLSYDLISGQVSSLATPTGELLGYAYNGHLISSVRWTGEVNGQVDFTHDNFFRVSGITVGGNTVSYGFDDDGLLTSAGSVQYTRDPINGAVTEQSIGSNTDTITYNLFGEMDSYTSDPISWVYERDHLSRITKKTETISGAPKIFEYHYDLAGRLDEVKIDGLIKNTYQYESNSNRLSKNNGAQNIYDSQDRLISTDGFAFTYSLNGDLESKTNTSNGDITNYLHDEFGNLIEVTLPSGDLISYIVDGENRRIGKKVNNTLVQGFLYKDSLNPVAELNPDGSVKAYFVYGLKENIPEYMIQNGQVYRILSDHLGSVRFVIDISSGSVVQEIEYDEFGIVLQDSNPGFQVFGYTGGQYDVQTKLLRLGVRDYSSELGRWISKDPVDFLGGDINLYGYTFNDPINLIDLDGESAVIPIFGGVIGIGGVGAIIGGGLIGSAFGGGYIIGSYIDEILIQPIWMGEHKKNKRSSTRGKHERGQTRKRRDSGGERGDYRRRPPGKRPKGEKKGPWPPKDDKSC